MPNIEDDIRKSGKRLKALRKTASAHNKANRIFVYKRDGRDVSEDALKSQMRSKGLSTESRGDPALKIPQKTSMVVTERPCESSGNALVAKATGASQLVVDSNSRDRKALQSNAVAIS